VETVQRALHYRITDLGTLRRMARLAAQQGQMDLDFAVEVDDSFCEREAYDEGRLSEAPDLSVYDQMFKNDEEEDPNG
jgi:hypothetical protein